MVSRRGMLSVALLYANLVIAINFTTAIATSNETATTMTMTTTTTTTAPTSATASTFDPYVMCSLIANGVMIKDPRACNAWIKCVDGVPETGTCDGDLFYDRVNQTCVAADAIACISSDPCASTAGSNGFVADPYTCNGYYYCHDGTGAHGQCSSGLNFNPGTQDCIRNFPCVAKMDPDNYCNIVPDRVFIKDASNCDGWQMCWANEVVSGTCPAGFAFDPASGVCAYADEVACAVTTTVPPNMPSTDECGAAGDFIADGHTCDGYYYCQPTAGGGIRLRYALCGQGRFFDPDYVAAVTTDDGDADAVRGVGACVDRTQVACPYNRCVGMGDVGIQLVNVADDGCAGYALCQGGEQIGAGTCPHGEYFDEVSQCCTTLTVSYPACALSSATTLVSDPTTTTTTTTTTPTTTTTTRAAAVDEKVAMNAADTD